MASTVEICNRALQKLGAKSITSLSDGSANARHCTTAYEPIKKRLLEKHDWVFARKRAELAADSEAPAWGRANAFTLPADFIKKIEPYPEDVNNQDDWEIEDGKILTNDTAPIYLRYTYDVTDTSKFPPLFAELLATELAFELCEALSQSNTKKEGLRGDASDIVAEAKKSNAFQRPALAPPEDPWITVRA